MDRFMIHNLFGIEGFNIAWYGVIIGVAWFLQFVLRLSGPSVPDIKQI